MDHLFRSALSEDCTGNDVTSLALVGEERVHAMVLLKQTGCVAGLNYAPRIWELHDHRVEFKIEKEEGALCERGTVLARLEGPARSLLSGERTMLNLLQHLSGVATLTREFVKRVQGTNCEILDTRKTLPGMRELQKYAVKIGGGVNHRLHLADQILIKNNHLTLVGSVKRCVELAKKRHSFVEVEVGNLSLLKEAIEAGADRVMLDNMSVEDVKECVAYAKGQVYLEVSGGIGLHNVEKYARTGVDGISIGALTHSAPALDICMRIKGSI